MSVNPKQSKKLLFKEYLIFKYLVLICAENSVQPI